MNTVYHITFGEATRWLFAVYSMTIWFIKFMVRKQSPHFSKKTNAMSLTCDGLHHRLRKVTDTKPYSLIQNSALNTTKTDNFMADILIDLSYIDCTSQRVILLEVVSASKNLWSWYVTYVADQKMLLFWSCLTHTRLFLRQNYAKVCRQENYSNGCLLLQKYLQMRLLSSKPSW